jgi:prevent-host-death family protein
VPHATVNGVRLYYEERGSGTPILGLHGAGSAAVFWEDAAERLAEDGRVITFDRRGSWRSERPEPYDVTSVREHADDALALLRVLDAEPAVLVGRSYGGTIALELALRHPESVLGIALLEAGPMGLSPEYDDWFRTVRAKVDEAGVDRAGETVLRDVFGAWEELPAVWAVLTARGACRYKTAVLCSYNASVEVGIRELRAHLSRYLDLVRKGEEIVVTDRGTPIARISAANGRSRIDELIAAGVIEPAPNKGPRKVPKPIEIKGGLSDLVDEQRG